MGHTTLNDAQLEQALATLAGWSAEGGALSRTFVMERYADGLLLAGAVGALAEGMNHHPELVIGYKRVTVRFQTHDAGNAITQQDVDAARAVDALGYPRNA
jgi:4a-hydroxytetrahydrobiopterin dehydratase